MKKIEAIVRKSKFEEVRAALHEADIDFLSWWEVKGQGTARQGLIFRGIAYDVNSVARMFISFVVRDINAEKSIKAILESAFTGESGDGRIFVTQIEQSIRVGQVIMAMNRFMIRDRNNFMTIAERFRDKLPKLIFNCNLHLSAREFVTLE